MTAKLPIIWRTMATDDVIHMANEIGFWDYTGGEPSYFPDLNQQQQHLWFNCMNGVVGLERVAPRTYKVFMMLRAAGTDETTVAAIYAALVAEARKVKATKLIAWASGMTEYTPAEMLSLFKMKPTGDVFRLKGAAIPEYQRTL